MLFSLGMFYSHSSKNNATAHTQVKPKRYQSGFLEHVQRYCSQFRLICWEVPCVYRALLWFHKMYWQKAVEKISKPGATFVKPDLLHLWIKDCEQITLLSPIFPVHLQNFVLCFTPACYECRQFQGHSWRQWSWFLDEADHALALLTWFVISYHGLWFANTRANSQSKTIIWNSC